MDTRFPQKNVRPNRRATPKNDRTITSACGGPPPGEGGGGGHEAHAGGAPKKGGGHFAAVQALSV
jgi:hypothetical protein